MIGSKTENSDESYLLALHADLLNFHDLDAFGADGANLFRGCATDSGHTVRVSGVCDEGPQKP